MNRDGGGWFSVSYDREEAMLSGDVFHTEQIDYALAHSGATPFTEAAHRAKQGNMSQEGRWLYCMLHFRYKE